MAVLTELKAEGRSSTIGRRLAIAFLFAMTGSSVDAVVYSTREQALARAFPPPATVERRTHFLTPAQLERASREAASKVESALVVAYLGKRDGQLLGTAYFDTHLVRTLTETILVTVRPDGSVAAVEVLAFGEPEDYLPRSGWLKLFEGRRLDRDLSPGRALAHVSGATLTTRAIADAVRRVLAIHSLVEKAP